MAGPVLPDWLTYSERDSEARRRAATDVARRQARLQLPWRRQPANAVRVDLKGVKLGKKKEPKQRSRRPWMEQPKDPVRVHLDDGRSERTEDAAAKAVAKKPEDRSQPDRLADLHAKVDAHTGGKPVASKPTGPSQQELLADLHSKVTGGVTPTPPRETLHLPPRMPALGAGGPGPSETKPPVREITGGQLMDFRQWAEVNAPELIGRRFVPRQRLDAAKEAYARYIALEKERRGAALDERAMGIKEGKAQPSLSDQAEAAAMAKHPGDPLAATKALAEAKRAGTGKGEKGLVADSMIGKALMGDPAYPEDAPGVLAEITADPIEGFMKAQAWFEEQSPAWTPKQREQVTAALDGRRPTLQDINKAWAEGYFGDNPTEAKARYVAAINAILRPMEVDRLRHMGRSMRKE